LKRGLHIVVVLGLSKQKMFGQYVIEEWRNGKIEVKSDKLTEADKLNGVEWSGTVLVSLNGPSRKLERGNWSEWGGGGSTLGPYYFLVRKNGKWIEPSDLPLRHHNQFFEKDTPLITCAEIPK
jgi:hypothetical protein